MKMYYYTALVRLRPETANRLAYKAPTLLAYVRDRVYVGRTTDPHRRAMNWRMDGTNSLGRTLRYMDKLGYVCYRDYIPMCRVWFCLVGAKNTPETTWDAPESAFKMMVARTPDKLHSQANEYSSKLTRSVRYHTSVILSKRTGADLEVEADAILAKLFKSKFYSR
jgi:hypothetical protein